jgi:hypothetical protein
MKTIKLSNSDQVALVSDEDYEQLNQFNWQLHPSGYASRCQSLGSRGNTQTILMHNAIMCIKGIDHKDTNKLNNQRDNLRLANKSQNAANLPINAFKTKYSYSQYKGVSWNKQVNKWIAQIMFHRVNYGLGYFASELEAAKAYNAKAIELFGEFARINEL